VPKIHKPGNLLRIIISSIGNLLHHLATFFHTIIHHSLPHPGSQVKNSFELVKNISFLKLPDDSVLMPLDIVLLFTNVPTDLVIHAVENMDLYQETR